MADVDMVVRVLKLGLKAVDESGVPPELRPTALREAIRLLSPDSHPTTETKNPAPAVRTRGPIGGAGTGDPLALLANKLGVGHDAVAEVFHLDDGELKLIVATSKLLSDKGPATKQIALLIAAGRQGAGIDPGWTDSKVIREQCDDFGKFDSANFANTLTSMGDVFSFDGKGKSRKVKVIRPGFERASTLVAELTGGNKK